MRQIMLLLIVLLAVTYCQAQSDVKIAVGERGQQYELTQQPIKVIISASVIKDDPKLHLTCKDDSYIIGQYDVSVLSENGSIIGPFTIKDKDEQKQFDKLYPYFTSGGKVYYDKLMLVCKNPPKTIAHPGVVVELQ